MKKFYYDYTNSFLLRLFNEYKEGGIIKPLHTFINKNNFANDNITYIFFNIQICYVKLLMTTLV